MGPRSARLRYLSQITAATDRRQGVAPTVARVVEYALARIGAATSSRAVPAADHDPGPRGGPAAELAALYHQRWEFETALDELKTHQRGPGVVLRSRSPRAWPKRSGPCSGSTWRSAG